MRIAANSVVSIDYTLRDDQGRTIDSSEDGAPLTYLHGHDNIIPGLEKELEGRGPGDALEISIDPEGAYGPRVDSKVYVIGRDRLPDDMDPEVGMQIAVEDPDGMQVGLWVTRVTDDEVTLDANHPLAGETLHFDVKVREVREATQQELDHGHVHEADSHAN